MVFLRLPAFAVVSLIATALAVLVLPGVDVWLHKQTAAAVTAGLEQVKFGSRTAEALFFRSGVDRWVISAVATAVFILVTGCILWCIRIRALGRWFMRAAVLGVVMHAIGLVVLIWLLKNSLKDYNNLMRQGRSAADWLVSQLDGIGWDPLSAFVLTVPFGAGIVLVALGLAVCLALRALFSLWRATA